MSLYTDNQIFIVLTLIINQKYWKVEINIEFSRKKLKDSWKMGIYLDSKFDDKSSLSNLDKYVEVLFLIQMLVILV